jgi:nitroimidazol reductase NimA-like FMN-containing flavoprotein (pyridoxamine 5'-phosphate oxidase superfamily)
MTKRVYHMRRIEREIHDRAELLSIMSNARYITLAMCDRNEPYLVTVNHVFAPRAKAVYFHCARDGKKVAFLSKNPRVCGEAIEDRGYVEGECDYDYRSVHFYGKAAHVRDITEKRHALNLLIEKLEKDPESAKKEFIGRSSLAKVKVFRPTVPSNY